MEKGIDISVHQGKINWNKVREAGTEFAIIRAGYGCELSQKDTQFDANIKGALETGIPVGLYWFGYAASPEGAQQEILVFDQIARAYQDQLVFPVFYDWEYDSARYIKQQGVTPTKELITAIVDAAIDKLRQLGYAAGVYLNPDYAKNWIDLGKLNGAFTLWLAQYGADKPAMDCDIWQYGSTGRVDGINGNVDMNKCYKLFTKPAPEKPAPPTPAPSPMPDGTYTVQPGDCLSAIGVKLGMNWQELARMNGLNAPYTIYSGQVLKLTGSTAPSKPAQNAYTVKSGDTLSGIGVKLGVSWTEIAKTNGINMPYLIYPGQKLVIPGRG